MITRLADGLHALRWRSVYVTLAALLVVIAAAVLFTFLEVGQLSRANTEDAFVDLSMRSLDHVQVDIPWRDDITQVESSLVALQELTGAAVTAFSAAETAPTVDGDLSRPAAERAQGPEVRVALSGEIGSNWRRSQDGVSTLYIAIPLYDQDQLLGAIRFAYPVPQLDAFLERLLAYLAILLLLSSIAVCAILLAQSVRTGRRLQLLTDMVERITSGDLDARVLTIHRGEVSRLAASLNRMADRLQNQTRKRQREKDRLNTILRTMTDGVVLLNKRGEVRTMNPAAAHILGVPLRSSHKRSFVQVVKDYRIAALWNLCMETNEQQSEAIDLANDASVHVVITPFLKRRARGYLVIIRDLTQLRRLQTVRQDFVSNVSHELRTPLASLRALVETLRDGALDDPPAAIHFLDRMEVEVDTLTQMVQELMELSRIESGKVPLQRRPVAPIAVIAPAAERLRAQAERAGLDLNVEIDADLPLVMADEGRVQQVVTNLVHNAIKFTPAGGRIDVRAVEDGGMVRITVHDTGIGMSPEHLERVFERFYKTDRSRAIVGTGLGLSIARHLVQAHGGEIWAESVENEWSEFGFTLPLVDGAVEDAPQSVASTENTLGQSSGVMSDATDPIEERDSSPSGVDQPQEEVG